jgi:hypothetical protein
MSARGNRIFGAVKLTSRSRTGLGRAEQQALPSILELQAWRSMGSAFSRVPVPSEDDRQLCIKLTHDDSWLLDSARAGNARKQLKSPRNSAEQPDDFQDRRLRPLGHLSAQEIGHLQARQAPPVQHVQPRGSTSPASSS